MNEKLPNQVWEFSAENCPNGSLAKVAKFHTNPYNFVACLPNPYKLSILGDIWRATILPFSSSKYFCAWLRLSNLVDLSFERISFSIKRKTTILLPSPLTFLKWPMLLMYWYHAVWRTQRLKQMAWNPEYRVMQVGGSASPSASIAWSFLATTQSISAQQTHSSSTNRFLVHENFHTYTYNFQSRFDILTQMRINAPTHSSGHIDTVDDVCTRKYM